MLVAKNFLNERTPENELVYIEVYPQILALFL